MSAACVICSDLFMPGSELIVITCPVDTFFIWNV